jgi:hypothetical protein
MRQAVSLFRPRQKRVSESEKELTKNRLIAQVKSAADVVQNMRKYTLIRVKNTREDVRGAALYASQDENRSNGLPVYFDGRQLLKGNIKLFLKDKANMPPRHASGHDFS